MLEEHPHNQERKYLDSLSILNASGSIFLNTAIDQSHET